MIKHIFLDLDDTILNFTAGEAAALSQALREIGIPPTEAVLDRYHLINIAHWELLEEGRLTREEVLVQRFEPPSTTGTSTCCPGSTHSSPGRSSF